MIWDLSDSELRQRLEHRGVRPADAEVVIKDARWGDPVCKRFVEELCGYAS